MKFGFEIADESRSLTRLACRSDLKKVLIITSIFIFFAFLIIALSLLATKKSSPKLTNISDPLIESNQTNVITTTSTIKPTELIKPKPKELTFNELIESIHKLQSIKMIHHTTNALTFSRLNSIKIMTMEALNKLLNTVSNHDHYDALLQSLSTLWLMDLKQEFNMVASIVMGEFDQRIIKHKQIHKRSMKINEFGLWQEVSDDPIPLITDDPIPLIIERIPFNPKRWFGSLLSCYALTQQVRFLDASIKLINLFKEKESTITFIPILEYSFLADLTNDSSLQTLISTDIQNNWNKTVTSQFSLDELHSQIMLKRYIQSNRTDKIALKMHQKLYDKMINSDLIYQNNETHSYVFNSNQNEFAKLVVKSSHCNFPAMIALDANQHEIELNANITPKSYYHFKEIYRNIEKKLKLANQIEAGCRDEMIRTGYFGFISDYYCPNFDFNEKTHHWGIQHTYIKNCPEAIINIVTREHNIHNLMKLKISPEQAETNFVLWRTTKDSKFIEYAWKMTKSIRDNCQIKDGVFYEHSCLIEYSFGSDHTLKSLNDEMLGNFIGKTLKYLYLTLADDRLLPLDRWILNDDGNPLPICGNEPIYPKKMCYNV